MAKRNTGDLGPFIITNTNGKATIKHQSAPLPTNKEELEAFFGDKFVSAFNKQKPFGETVAITSSQQLGTENLDYRIECEKADYLELAEITPLTEEWGREALKSGVIDIYQMGKWTWQEIIGKKAVKYGDLCRRTFLLLYSTHPSLLASQNLFDLLRSTLQDKGCPFAGVFYELVIGGDTAFIEVLAPWKDKMPAPRTFKGMKLQNLNMREATSIGNAVFFGPSKI